MRPLVRVSRHAYTSGLNSRGFRTKRCLAIRRDPRKLGCGDRKNRITFEIAEFFREGVE